MKRNSKRSLALLLSLALTAGLSACEKEPADTPAPEVSAPAGVSGDFSATAKGFGGDVTVTLTIADNTLIDVKIVGEGETLDVGGRAIELLPGTMTAANSVEVDGISGATVTSEAILAAAKKALTASGAVLET